MKQETKLLFFKIMILVLPVLVLLGTAMLVSGNGFGLGAASSGTQSSPGTGCNRPHP